MIRILRTLILLFLVIPQSLQAQRSLSTSIPKSDYRYMYRLDSAQVAMYMKDSTNLELFLTNLQDSFPVNQSIPRFTQGKHTGYYLYIWAQGTQVYYQMQERTYFRLQVAHQNDEVMLRAYDWKAQPIKEARLLVNGKVIKYREDCGCYAMPYDVKKRRSFGKSYYLSYGPHFTFGRLYASKYQPPKNRRGRRSNTRSKFKRSSIMPGYLTFNKPKYQPEDTVRFKAFVVNRKGKPYKKPLDVWFKDNANYRNSLNLTTLDPLSPGAYAYDFVLGDSLSLNRYYNIILYNHKGQAIHQNNFLLEDYLLRETRYEARMAKSQFTNGEQMVTYAKAEDANGLPLLDAKVKVKVWLTNVDDYYDRHLFVPYQWMVNYYETELLLDPSGETRIAFPKDLFPNAKLRGKIKLLFTNSANEIHEKLLDFNWDAKGKKDQQYEVVFENDSLRVNYWIDGLPVSKNLLMKATGSGEVLQEEMVNLPFVTFPDHRVTQYTFYDTTGGREALIGQTAVPTQWANRLLFYGERMHDTIRMVLYNPLGVEVSYRIYRDDKQIAGGQGKTLDFGKADGSTKPYYVRYYYNWAGQPYVKEQVFGPRTQELKVSIDQPEKVYPGQQVAVSVKVTDFKERPVKNANLTAYAINAQFDQPRIPVLPDFNPSYSARLVQHRASSTPAKKENTRNVAMTPFLYQKLRLHQNPWYHFVFHWDDPLQFRYEPIDSGLAELAPFVFKPDGSMDYVHLIYVDDQPIFYSQVPAYYSFAVSPGVHELKLRTSDQIYTIPNVSIKNHQKLFVGVYTDSTMEGVQVDTVKIRHQLDGKEMQQVTKNMLWLRISGSGHPKAYVQQENKIIPVYTNSKAFKIPSYGAGGRKFRPVGWLKPGKIRLYREDGIYGSVIWEPGTAYDYSSKDEIVSYGTRRYGLVEGFQFFPTRNINANNYSFKDRAPRWSDLQAWRRKLEKQREQKRKQRQPQAGNRPKPADPKDNHFMILKENYQMPYNKTDKSRMVLRVKGENRVRGASLWLMHQQDSIWSVVQYGQQYGLSNLKSGAYDLLVMSADSQAFAWYDFPLKAKGTHYVTVTSEDFGPRDSKWPARMKTLIGLKAQRGLERYHSPSFDSLTYVDMTPEQYFWYNRRGGHLLEGRVTDLRTGNPIGNILVWIEQYGQLKAVVLANASGYFRVKGLEPGSYTLKTYMGNAELTVLGNVLLKRNTKTFVWVPLSTNGTWSWNRLIEKNNPNAYRGNRSDGTYYSYSDDVQLAPALDAKGSVSLMSVETISATSIRKLNVVRSLSRLPGVIGSGLPKGPAQMAALENGQVGPDADLELSQIAASEELNRIRSNFRDYAYWVPNLLTTKTGEAHFTVRFPDNQTMWRTIVPAMTGKRQSGIGLMNTQAYKPLSASIALPRFLLTGDEIVLPGKVLNYTSKPQSMQVRFEYNGTVVDQKNVEVDKVDYSNLSFSTDETDTAELTFALETPIGYVDGERRKLKIRPDVIEITEGNHYPLDRDTTVKIQPLSGAVETQVTVHNEQLEAFLEEIAELKKYRYGCAEQTASKLLALVLEQNIRTILGQPFEDQAMVQQMIKRLDKFQNTNGSWGWWSRTKPSLWITLHVTQALEKARRLGYPSKGLKNGIYYIKNQVDHGNIKPDDQLAGLLALSEMGQQLNYEKYLEPLVKLKLNTGSKLRIALIKQKQGLPFSMDSLVMFQRKENIINNGVFWTQDFYMSNVTHIGNITLAYKVLSRDGTYSSWLPRIRTHLTLERRKGLQYNTLEKATLLETLVSDLSVRQELQDRLTSKLTINGQVQTVFPFRTKVNPDQELTVSKEGAPLYLSIYTTRWVRDPEPEDSLYAVKTSLLQDGKTISSVKAGEPVTLLVEVDAKQTSEYVMLEVPIPAGCVYADQNTGRRGKEIHREYFANQVSIFCEDLPEGKYQFRVHLEPRFTGKFKLLPTQIAPMYQPDLSGRNASRMVEIK